MYNSKYYTCEQIDQRLLQNYYDDAVAAGYTGSKAQYLAGLLKAINYSANPILTADKVVYNSASDSYKNVQEALVGITQRVTRIRGVISVHDDLDLKKETSDIGLWYLNRSSDSGIVLVCYDFQNTPVHVKLSATRTVEVNHTEAEPSVQYRKYIDGAWTEWADIEFNILKTNNLVISGIPLEKYVKSITPKLVSMSEAAYEALETKEADTYYMLTEE